MQIMPNASWLGVIESWNLWLNGIARVARSMMDHDSRTVLAIYKLNPVHKWGFTYLSLSFGEKKGGWNIWSLSSVPQRTNSLEIQVPNHHHTVKKGESFFLRRDKWQLPCFLLVLPVNALHDTASLLLRKCTLPKTFPPAPSRPFRQLKKIPTQTQELLKINGRASNKDDAHRPRLIGPESRARNTDFTNRRDGPTTRRGTRRGSTWLVVVSVAGMFGSKKSSGFFSCGKPAHARSMVCRA